ncbi:rCG41406, partial [Rattus norvegicus]
MFKPVLKHLINKPQYCFKS